jgi:hypothetical protein
MPIRIKPLPKSDPLKKSPAMPGGILVALPQLYGFFRLGAAVSSQASLRFPLPDKFAAEF